MLTICLCVTSAPVQERGWILEVLRTADERRKETPTPHWVILPRKFACKSYALRAVRREIRTGAAVAAKLYWGGDLKGYWQKCPTTGRELRMNVALSP